MIPVYHVWATPPNGLVCAHVLGGKPLVPPQVPPQVPRSLRGVLCGAFCVGSRPAKSRSDDRAELAGSVEDPRSEAEGAPLSY